MKIYEVSWISEDDTTQHKFFTSKRLADKLQAKLKKIDKQAPEFDDEDDEINAVKCLFDINIMTVDISAKGILTMLNKYFNETQ